jgi:N-acetylglucosaminyldiphosphoundecaprenol N-acetyl-beta-D-mannosaminyltransferase
LNAFCLTEAADDEMLQKCYKGKNTINLIDGFPILMLAKLSGWRQVCRIRGSDFTRRIFKEQMEGKIRLGLIGGNVLTINDLIRNITNRFPGLEFEMVYSPPYSEVSSYPVLEIASSLKSKKIDLCLIAIGTPKQDQLAQILGKLCSTDFACVGAAIDFISGVKQECPNWLSKIGLEWLFRFASEPKRLWKRYTFGLIQFLKLVLNFHFFKKLT